MSEICSPITPRGFECHCEGRFRHIALDALGTLLMLIQRSAQETILKAGFQVFAPVRSIVPVPVLINPRLPAPSAKFPKRVHMESACIYGKYRPLGKPEVGGEKTLGSARC